jgi:beta-galactosidase
MAEMKNEGIPYWVFRKHPEIVPTTWDNENTPTATLDYLAPAFLKEVDKWYQEVMKIARPRLFENGGNIVAIQLDNEIGMLSWVSNSPDLNDNVLLGFRNYLQEEYSKSVLEKRYPFKFDILDDFRSKIISPEEEYALRLLKDLGYFMRKRYKVYVNELRRMTEKYGAKATPFIVNIHGTSSGRCLTYPIGISQLYEAYQGEGIMGGSDIYTGNLGVENIQDLYLTNAFMRAVDQDHPLSSVEFNCSDGNYGDNLGSRYDVSSVDLKARLFVAQENRLLNYYLLAGGYNYRLQDLPNDGNDRIAITGERHGFASPISPEGELTYLFPRMSKSIKTILTNQKLASMEEELDNVTFAFIPDYFMTEYYYPKSKKMKSFIKNLETNRIGSAWEIVAKALLLKNYRFGAIDIQNNDLDISKTKVLVLASALYMDKEIQTKLEKYLYQGGSIFLLGELPLYDMEGNPCTILGDAIGVKIKETIYDKDHYYLSIYPENWVKGVEIRSSYAQQYSLASNLPLFKIYGSDEICGFESKVGKGKIIVVGCSINMNFRFVEDALHHLGAKKVLEHDNRYGGVFLTTTRNEIGERYLHLLNLDNFEKELTIYQFGIALFEGLNLHIQGYEGLMLPLDINMEGLRIIYSSAEIFQIRENEIEFRLSQPQDIIYLESNYQICPSDEFQIKKDGNKYKLISNKNAKIDNKLVIRFEK